MSLSADPIVRPPPLSQPGFYPKNQLLLARACSKLGRTDDAREWLRKCLAATPSTPEDEETLKEAAGLKL